MCKWSPLVKICKCANDRPWLMCKCVNAKCADAQMQRYTSFHLHIFTFAHLHIVKHCKCQMCRCTNAKICIISSAHFHICTLLSICSLYGIHLRLVLLQDAASIVATEAESIAEGSAYGALLCLIEGEVEVVVDILIAIVLFVVDCRRYDIVLY